ncbi:hypothetical protein ACEUAM_21520 [Aeromonas hydrophila]|uniref:hypothetical protein n=1 Tax=Aeromonas hydrophila TaxID=644 RepID=UPI0038D209FC
MRYAAFQCLLQVITGVFHGYGANLSTLKLQPTIRVDLRKLIKQCFPTEALSQSALESFLRVDLPGWIALSGSLIRLLPHLVQDLVFDDLQNINICFLKQIIL